MTKKIVIVGGVAGGASTATRLRRLDEGAEIIMFERDEHISFANCGLPYYIGDNIKDRSKLIVQTPEAMRNLFKIDVRVKSEVISVDTVKKQVTVRSQDRGEYTESFDYLVLSPGAKPIKPRIPGIESPMIYTLRNIPDTDKIKDKIKGAKSALVIGGGYIGVEMAENLKEAGLDVTLAEAAPQILAPFDYEMAAILSKELEDYGISIILSDGVASFRDNENTVTATLTSGKEITADIIILAIGVAPDTAFLRNSGIELAERGHILVNENLLTNIESIYATGDAVEVIDYVNGKKAAIPLAGPANKQGRIVADNICCIKTEYKGTMGTSIIKVFGLAGAAVGNNERTLKRYNIPYNVIYTHPGSHAAYYPDSTPMSLKLIFSEDGTILGAQGVGSDGVDKRIDDIAAVIHFKGTIKDLTELELSYAPPFSSAKDPVNMLGYVAENLLTHKFEVIQPSELESFDANKVVLLDVRAEISYQNGHIENAVHIPLDELRSRLNELDKSKEIWTYCQVGLNSYTAVRLLTQNGFKAKSLVGGYRTYMYTKYEPKKNSDTAITPGSPVTSGLSDALRLAEATTSSLEQKNDVPATEICSLDACGICCPGPLIRVKQNMDELKEGQILKVTATDPGFYEDIKAWASMSKNEIISLNKHSKGIIEASIRKGSNVSSGNSTQNTISSDSASMVVFSGDLDKAIAAFIIANGAASSGKKVTMFFTFWGLNILRKHEKVHVKKDIISRMFGMMMPRGSQKLKLSKMSMSGMGGKMIRMIMKKNNVLSLEELIQTAQKQGVKIVACTMSMDLMGINKEELIEGVDYGGVGYYIGQADKSGINLFI